MSAAIADNSTIPTGPLVDDAALDLYFSTAGSDSEIIGFGSLMSKTSSLGTFPSLRDFRIVRVHGYRRVYRHPASIFFERGIADLPSLRISSLSCERAENHSFLAVAFRTSGETSAAFLRREEEFSFDLAPYEEVSVAANTYSSGVGTTAESESRCTTGNGIICVNSSEDVFISRWGRDAYEEKYLNKGLHSIWGWDVSSGILPCSVYLRHCYLAAKGLSPAVLDSFLDDTFLADRQTTIRTYLSEHPEVLEQLPPESLIGRYSG